MSQYGHVPTADESFEGKYIVWSPESAQAPKMLYNNRQDAIKTAFQMANKFPNQRFTVCKVVGVAQAVKAEYKDLDS